MDHPSARNGEHLRCMTVCPDCIYLATVRQVLAGDPKQLGAQVHSPKAQAQGFDVSLQVGRMICLITLCHNEQERLMGSDCYKDGRHSIMLLSNYRSHSSILELSSSLFYGVIGSRSACVAQQLSENKLRFCADPNISDSMLQWDELPRNSAVVHRLCPTVLDPNRLPLFSTASTPSKTRSRSRHRCSMSWRRRTQ